MIKLLYIEWLKVKSYRTFYVFIIAYILLTLLFYYGFDKFVKTGPVGLFDLSVVYKFPDVWYYAAYISTWFATIPGLLIINLTSNEISFRTMRQQITDGLSRLDYLKGKLSLIISMSILTGILVFLSGLTFGLLKGGLPSSADFFAHADYIFRAMWVSFGMMSAALFIALLVKRSALAILIFLGIIWIIEPLLGRIWMADIYPYFPMNSLDEFITSPLQLENVKFGMAKTPLGVFIAGIIYPILFVLGAYRILKTEDI